MIFPIYAMTTYLKRKFLRKVFPQRRRRGRLFEGGSFITLIGETFAKFANFCLFRESLSRESFQNGNSRKFIQ